PDGEVADDGARRLDALAAQEIDTDGVTCRIVSETQHGRVEADVAAALFDCVSEYVGECCCATIDGVETAQRFCERDGGEEISATCARRLREELQLRINEAAKARRRAREMLRHR